MLSFVLLGAGACQWFEHDRQETAPRSGVEGKPVLKIGDETVPKGAFLDYAEFCGAGSLGEGAEKKADSLASMATEGAFSGENNIEDTETRAAMLSRLYDRFIVERLLLYRARRQGLAATPQEAAGFLKALDINPDSLPEARRRKLENMAREAVAVRKYVDAEVLGDLRITEDEIAAYYQSHLDEFAIRPKYRFRWMHFTDRAEADRAHQQLHRRGAVFEEVADDFQTPIEGGQEGQEGLWDLGEVPESFASAITRTPPGAVTEPLPDPYGGYTIFEILETIPARQPSLEEARPIVAYRLREEKGRRLFEQFVSNMVREKEIKTYHENLDFAYVPR